MSELKLVRKSEVIKPKPSVQQSNFYDWIVNGTGSCVLEAVAGAGKTTTLCEAVRMMEGKIFFGAFSKDIAGELQKRIGHLGKADISTLHAFGLREWKKVADKFVKIDGNKCRDIFRELNWKHVEYAVLEQPVLQLVSYAKQAGVAVEGVNLSPHLDDTWNMFIDHFGIETFSEKQQIDNRDTIIMLAKQLYEVSLKACKKIIDFDDMLLAPLFFNVTITKYDWVLIDEAQDTNAVRRELALRMMHENTRLVAVGDRHQAIFGFTGADADSLDRITKETNACVLPLTASFRCAKNIIAEAQKYVSHIQSADWAIDGTVVETDNFDNIKLGDAILCRFNAPLMKQAYNLIAKGIPARVEGREIGQGLKTLVNRWKVKDLFVFLDRLNAYQEREVEKQRKRENMQGVDAVNDRVECLRIIVERVRARGLSTQQAVLEEIDTLFGNSDDPTTAAKKPHVRLSSIHKAKGREWDTVFWIQTEPSKWAKKHWQQEQENNLMYVAITRAKSTLVMVELPKDKD